MNPDKEKLLHETHHKFVETSLHDFPMNGIDEFIDPEIMAYGTAIDEKLFSISDYRDLLIRQREQGKDYEIKFDQTPIKYRITSDGNSAILIDEIMLSIFMDKETLKLFMRLTTVYEHKKGKWIVIHFHGSKPDNESSETDTWHVNEWKRKNTELEKQVNEKTADLIVKNRELEIEASLERVRAVAMSMNKSEDLLRICETFFKEFKILGFNNLRNSLINIFNDKEIFFVNYDYSDYMGGSISNVSYHSSPANDEFLIQIRKANDAFVETVIDRNQLDEWKEFRRSHGEQDDPRLDNINALYYYSYSIGSGSIGISSFNPISKEQQIILKRFRNVFDLAYRRYNDITLAEAQTKEAQIEAALEKVRAVAMSMMKPDDLLNVCEVMFKELQSLRFTKLRNTLISTYQDDKDYFDEYDYSDASGGYITKIPYSSHPTLERFQKQIWRTTDAFAEFIIGEDQLNDWKEHRRSNGEPDDPRLENISALYCYFYSIGPASIGISTFNSISEEMREVLKRFKNVFDLAYRRYIDIAQAEAQAREAQIQLALERVRARTMAMYKSEELAETAAVLFQQMMELGVTPERLNICLIKEETKILEVWSTDQEGIKINHHFNASLEEPTTGKRVYNAWKEKKKSLVIDLSGQELNDWISYVREVMGMTIKEELVKEHRIHSVAFFSHGMVLTTTPEPLPDESMNLLERFADVFNLTYRRFIDLKKAEAQAREAQIEGALERVRSKTMAMHNSNDVGDTVVTLFDEVLKLGLDKSIRCGIGILEGNEGMETWSATSHPNGKVDLKMGMLDMTIHPMLIGLKKAWESGETSYSYDYIGDDVFRYYEALNNEPDYPFQADLESLPENEYHKSFFYKEGILFSFAPNPISDEAAKVLDRFARVFGQTYRRYQDLRKAEAQARESQIEASLERVRSKAMSMNSSEDLALTIDHFFHELKNLNIKLIRCGVGIKDGDSRTVDVTVTSTTEKGEDIKLTGKLTLGGHPILDKVYEALQLQAEYFPVLRGEEISEYYQAMNPDIEFPNFTEDDVQYGYYFHYEEGGVFAWTEKELLDEEINIFRKFKSVLSLTYRRYIDLKEAEASSVEAVRQASLDRVRAEIASMRTSEDLNHITPIIWRELKILEVPFFRCGVFIVDEDQATVQVYLTTPDGKSLGVLNLPFDSNELTSNTFEFWRRKEVYKEHWNKEEFISWSKSMLELGQIKSQQEYQGAEKPPESLDLHFIPFEQGMLYVGNKEPLTLEKIDLVKSLADAFSIAYARYEDFEQLETAKKEVESAFGELDLLSKELKIKNEELESENQRKALELEEARQLQLSMLPKELPKLPTLDIAVYMKTATEVGGDYYDFYIHPNGTLTVLIGDATGHGMKSGMMVSIMKSFFIANRNNIELKHFFENSNKSIKDMQLGRLMMACMGVQITSKKVIATNAGMPSLIYFRNKSQKAGEFVINHMPLGAMNGSKYSLKEISYEKGDTLLLMSDGFGELMNKNNEQYGYPRIIKEFKSVVQKSSNEIVDHLKNSADKWIKGIEPDDDVTFVVIKVK